MLHKIVDNTSKFKRLHVEKGKALNHIIHKEERIINLLKSLKNQKIKITYIHLVQNQGYLMDFVKFKRLWRMKFHFLFNFVCNRHAHFKFAKFCVRLLRPIITYEYTIKDLLLFAKEVEEFDPNLVMASSDVTPLSSYRKYWPLCQESLQRCNKKFFS